jgi:ABC-type transporter MlaC component
MMLEDVNLDYVSKFVIGKYARLMDTEQKKKYNDLFKRYVLSLYKQTSFEFDASKVDFSIQSITEYAKFTTVSCLVDPGNISKNVKIEKIPVKFKLIRGVDNRIQAVDVEISEVSMVIEYRKRFYQMIQSDGGHIDFFLEKLEDKVRANEEAVYKKAAL